MIVVKAPNKHVLDDRVTIFLGGVIDQGKASNWAEKIAEALKDYDVVLLNPRRDNWDSSLPQTPSNPEFLEQVTWELDYQDIADIKVYVFGENEEEAKAALAPIALLELGLYSTANPIVCCPETYWRFGNVRIVCTRYGIECVGALDKLIFIIKRQIKTIEAGIKFANTGNVNRG